MEFGYCRVSTDEQKVNRQYDSLIQYVKEPKNIYIDFETGKNYNRIQYRELKKIVREGDVIYFHELDRLGRSSESKEEIRYFKNKGVRLCFLDLPTTLIECKDENLKPFLTLIENLLIEILTTFAESELKRQKKRQQEGIAIARAQGKYQGVGRKCKPLPKKFDLLYQQYKQGLISATEFTEILGYKSRSSFYRTLKRYEDNVIK